MFYEDTFFDKMLFQFGPFFIGIIFIIVISLFVIGIFSTIKEGVKNKQSPILSVPSQIVTKRTEVRGDHARTTYYTTFEVQSGDRLEFTVSGEQYGMHVEQDLGMLTFQGTKFISFERSK